MHETKSSSSFCPYFPACGGCDYLNLSEEEYRQLKAKNLQEILKGVFVEPHWIWVGPHSRRRVNLQIDKENHCGFFAAKSNQVVEIGKCFVAEKEISDLILPLQNFLKNQEQNFFSQISVTLFDNGLDLIFSAKKDLNFSQIQQLITFAKAQNLNVSCRVKNHLTPIFLTRRNQIFYDDLRLGLDSDVFIQATKSGLNGIIEIIRSHIKKGQKIVDFYAGFGAYSFAIYDLAKSISAFEGDKKMVDLINKNAAENNLAGKIKAEVCDLFSSPLSKNELNKFDLAIINPPRNGASPQVLQIAQSTLKNIIYVSCNPHSFLRDAKILIDYGFKIAKIYALDQFYRTKHLELITIFHKS